MRQQPFDSRGRCSWIGLQVVGKNGKGVALNNHTCPTCPAIIAAVGRFAPDLPGIRTRQQDL